jgi:hypothetical protein
MLSPEQHTTSGILILGVSVEFSLFLHTFRTDTFTWS